MSPSRRENHHGNFNTGDCRQVPGTKNFVDSKLEQFIVVRLRTKAAGSVGDPNESLQAVRSFTPRGSSSERSK